MGWGLGSCGGAGIGRQAGAAGVGRNGNVSLNGT